MSLESQYSYPRGWFVVSFSDDLKPGDVKPIRYFGQDLVLFRTDAGQPCIIDAHCPHLGAHLGHGGTVEGDCVRCPFHAWTFNGRGECTGVPYAKKIPKKSSMRAWPVSERNAMIFVYHDPEGQEPEFEIPLLAECGDPEWMPWDHSVLHIKTHPREIVENVADLGHFKPVHGTVPEVFENAFDGHMAIQTNEGKAYPRGGGVDAYSLTATYHGPGYQVTQMSGVLESRLVNAHTPIDENSLDLRFAVSLRIARDRETTAAFSKQYIENLRTGFLEDVAIWEHKVYRDKPMLCDGDGPIAGLRRWYSQFYQPSGS